MKGKLLAQAAVKFILGLAAIALLLFFPAGTLDFWNAWLLGGLLFIPMAVLGIVLWVKTPVLLEKRLNTKEKETEQKQVVWLSLIMFLGGFITAGLDFRFGWSRLPLWLIVLASVLLLIGYAMYGEVMRENAYLSRTVEVQQNQQVIDTGLYGVVRHPMYLATILLFLAMPIVLGSIPALLIFLLYPFLLIKRITNEEIVLSQALTGYEAYKQKVRYRLIPFIW
ncbi:methyltransferase family protein [Enterococcus sp. LJL128]|uniref:methyltransferase family protein n=1 Tax=Enterococcus sp. LJL51 TaxID=3416656 RepID=UPI003CE73DB1